MKPLMMLVMSLARRVLAAVPASLPTAAQASGATLGVIAACGWAEDRNAIAPINAIAHALRGEEARGAGASTCTPTSLARFTAPAVALNTFAMFGWALIFHTILGSRARPGAGKSLAGGALVSLLAWVVDYRVVPPRLTPGIEARLSGRSIFVTYVVLALVLAIGAAGRRE